jgi:hypothetical protein
LSIVQWHLVAKIVLNDNAIEGRYQVQAIAAIKTASFVQLLDNFWQCSNRIGKSRSTHL